MGPSDIVRTKTETEGMVGPRTAQKESVFTKQGVKMKMLVYIGHLKTLCFINKLKMFWNEKIEMILNDSFKPTRWSGYCQTLRSSL